MPKEQIHRTVSLINKWAWTTFAPIRACVQPALQASRFYTERGNLGTPSAASHIGSAGVSAFSKGDEFIARDMNGITNEAVLDRATSLAGPEFPVGTRFAYSGMGYVLLAMIVATVYGQSSAEFLKARIFDPLGMKHTVAYDQSRPARHRLAHGYLQEKDRSSAGIIRC